jgi:hypothetical protein
MSYNPWSRHVVLAVGAAFSLSLATVGAAQNTLADSAVAARRAVVRGISDSVNAPTDPLDPRGDDKDVKLAPSIAIAIAPKSFSVVRVPVPTSFGNGATISYSIVPSSQGIVVGQHAGILAPSSDARTLLVTLGVASRMRAGQTPLARVRFTSGSEQIDVPILVSVPSVHRIQITTTEQLGGIRAGSLLRLGYRVTNLGNAADTVDLEIRPPTGWEISRGAARSRVVLGVNATIERVAQLATPVLGSGMAHVEIVGLSHGAPIASNDMMVELVSDQRDVAASGPELRLGTATTGGQPGATASAYTAELNGNITDALTVSGRASFLPDPSSAASYLFGRANIYQAPPSLMLSTSTWHAGGGVVGTNFSDLSGFSVGGVGFTAGVDEGPWSASAIAARPGVLLGNSDGEFAGTRVERRVPWGNAFSSVTHLLETGPYTRQLDAASVGTTMSNVFGGRFVGELAGRRYQDGTGLGWSTSYQRRDQSSSLNASLTHAPGGSGAYARATDDFSASASRTINRRVSLNASSWRTSDDANSGLGKISIEGLTANGRLAIADAVGVTLGGRRSSFDASTASGGFNDQEKAIDAAADVRVGAVTLVGSASRSIVERGANAIDGESSTMSAPRTTIRGSLRTAGSIGTVVLSGNYEKTDGMIGAAVGQWGYTAQWNRDRLVSLGRIRVDANAMVQQMGGLAGYRATTIATGLVASTARGTSFTLSAERNPFSLSTNGSRGWMYLMGMSHALHLPRLSRVETRGLIYKDLNGNGARDNGEPGLSGVIIRRGFDVAVTDDDGVFMFVGDTPQALEIDARSLPLGWLAPSTTISRDARVVGVIGVTSIPLRLVVDPADSDRVALADLERISLVATDSTGRAWVARRTSAVTAMFDALPPGTYSLDIDVSDAKEPLRIGGTAAAFRVGSGEAVTERAILIRPRALKFTAPNRQFRRDDQSGAQNPSSQNREPKKAADGQARTSPLQTP